MLTLLTSAVLLAAVVATSAPRRAISAIVRRLSFETPTQPSVNLFSGLGEEFELQTSAANDNRRPRRRAVANGVTWLREVEHA